MLQLEPSVVWRHFATLCRIPRPSRHEAALRQTIADWASRRGLAVATDGVGNLLIRKPASPGKETAAPVALQAHLDMVCQANAGTRHDFTRDPITPVVKDGWLVAENTTLGADNGIGVALALAALEEDGLTHPPLEVLLTIDEETGMTGAHGLTPGWLRATRMLNLDTEAWGEFFLGCAGGCDVTVERACRWQAAPDSVGFWRLDLSGLKGGHSGVDIHLGRGNANKLLVRLLRQWDKRGDIRLAGFSGGTARNALPREAWALFACAPGRIAALQGEIASYQALIALELADRESGIDLALTAAAPSRLLDLADQRSLLSALHAAPFGVKRMSGAFPGVVETSNNLGIVTLSETGFTANLMVRSLRDSATADLASEIESLFLLAGCQVTIDGAYPGWTPNPASPLLAQCQQVYAKEFGAKAATQIIHAGLECGIIGAKYPGIDTVSFGPTIQGAHAPGEQVEIRSVGDCWHLLKAILAAL